MYGTPFCAHEFTEEQLGSLKQVVCPCGNKYLSKELIEFNRLRKLLTETNESLGSLVQAMAVFNGGNKVSLNQEVAPVSLKPKRERPKLSVTQWLIVVAGFLVLVAASVFVSQNLNSWNVYAWSTLELSLGLVAGFGAFRLKRFSILLSNFLAVFSSAMLLTLIMSFSTTFGWGFTAWDNEPAWFWSVNLGTVAVVSLLLGMWSKNFGWRAIAPLSLTASALTLVVNSAGAFEDRWRVAVLSVALFAVLIAVRLARNAKWEIESGVDEDYLKDLQAREDNSLKRFGIAVSILLAAFGAIDIIQQLALDASAPIDGIAALVTAAVWLVGARINRSWVSALVEKDETVLSLRNSASAIGLSFLGLGILSLIYGVDYTVGLTVAVLLLLLVFMLERFAKFLLLPTFAVTIAAWVTVTFGGIWYLKPDLVDYYRPFGFYLVAIALVLSIREFLNFSRLRTIAIYATGFVGSVSVFLYYRAQAEADSLEIALALALTLIGVNLFPALVRWLEVRAKVIAFSTANWIPLVQSSLISLIASTAFFTSAAKPILMTVASGYLLVSLAGVIIFKGKELAQKFTHQGYVAIGLSVLLSVFSGSIDALKVHSAFILVDGLMILGFALLTKNIRWANVGYAVTSLSVVIANNAWGTDKNSSLIAAIAMTLGAAGNLGLIWANKQFGKGEISTRLVTRITTGISLVLIIASAQRFVSLSALDYWILLAVPAAIALMIELRAKSNFAFIYAGAALFAAAASFTNQPEVNFNSRLAVVFALITFLLIRRSLQTKKPEWAIGSQISIAALGFFVVRVGYNQFNLDWDGPELYAVTISILLAIGAWLTKPANGKMGRYLRLEIPLAAAITPSVIYSWTSITKQFSALDATEISRTLIVLAISIAVMVIGILRGNRGLNLIGTVELWLIAVPGLWFKTSAVDNGSADLELRGLIIAGVLYWAIYLLRKYSGLKLKSVVFIGIPVTIALGPAIFHTLSSLGGSEIRSLDWWRFGIVLTVSLVLLVTGSLREIGGTFFPGLIGVIVTVLPYGFHPLTNKEWFLWAILLGVAGLLVWLAVRLENMRKAGREPSAWLKELK